MIGVPRLKVKLSLPNLRTDVPNVIVLDAVPESRFG
jgi:hypothetical protein